MIALLWLALQLLASAPTPAADTYFKNPDGGRSYNIEEAAHRLNGLVLAPGAQFSFLRATDGCAPGIYRPAKIFIGQRIALGFGGGLCQVASTLYRAALPSDLLVVERHAHSLVTEYLPPGEDATVACGALDLVLKNPLAVPVTVQASAQAGHLHIVLLGAHLLPDAQIEHQVLEVYPHGQETVEDAAKPTGYQRQLRAGHDGVLVHSWLSFRGPDGQRVRQDLGIDRYGPIPERLLRGPTVPNLDQSSDR